MMDTSEILVAALAAVGGIVLIVIALRWRSALMEAHGLPFWGFMRREGILPADAADSVSAKTLRQAELACSVCGSKDACCRQLETGSVVAPPAHCPNRRLFREFGLWTTRHRG